MIHCLDGSNFGDYADYNDSCETAVQGSLLASTVDDKKIVVFSFWEADSNDEDDTCVMQEIRDPFDEVEIIVIIAGCGGINNEFDCLTSGGGGSGKSFNINKINEDVLINSAPDHTNLPTNDPTERPTSSPTDAPTSQPTNDHKPIAY